MSDRPPALGRLPGPGEITVATPLGRPLCTTLEHRRALWRADVVVLFGPLASWAALFPGCWGRSYPLCAQCWQDTRRLAVQHHPAVVIHDVTNRTGDVVLGRPAGKCS
jgi:hypothetical protein